VCVRVRVRGVPGVMPAIGFPDEGLPDSSAFLTRASEKCGNRRFSTIFTLFHRISRKHRLRSSDGPMTAPPNPSFFRPLGTLLIGIRSAGPPLPHAHASVFERRHDATRFCEKKKCENRRFLHFSYRRVQNRSGAALALRGHFRVPRQQSRQTLSQTLAHADVRRVHDHERWCTLVHTCSHLFTLVHTVHTCVQMSDVFTILNAKGEATEMRVRFNKGV
jgi:hypothetical protein